MPVAYAWQTLGTLAPAVWLAGLGVCFVLIWLLSPLFGNHALAIPNDRSSHTTATPQWGGLAICGATLVAVVGALLASAAPVSPSDMLYLFLGAALLVLLGALDDRYELGAAVKLFVQALGVAFMLAAIPIGLQPLPLLPAWSVVPVLFIGTLWFVNLVNFMDGLDWMMVAEVVPITAGVALIAAIAPLPVEALVVALALNGAMLGFAPFNRPVAKLFMGDTGSLPVGLVVAWLLVLVAGSGHVVAAVLLPLYFVADTGVTLIRRLRAGERVWQAHRTHFYQRARAGGFGTLAVVARVLAVNVGLVALAAMSTIVVSLISKLLLLLAGCCIVGWLMIEFVRGAR